MAAAGIFFLHNPKAGGTAVSAALAARYTEDQRAPLIENDAAGHARLGGDYSGFRGYRWYSGHYGRDVFDAVATDHVPVTNVRHPVERIRSLYNYYRLQVDVPDDDEARAVLAPVVIAQSVDLHDFATSDDPSVTVHTRDWHCRQLTGSPWEPADHRTDVDAAIAFLDRMPWIYVCEEPAASQAWAARVLGPDLGEIPRENVTASARRGEVAVVDVPERTRAAIEEANAADLALHARALERLAASAAPGRRWRLGRR